MKNNITYILLSALILVALPACCGSKKNKTTKTNEVTINNEVDSLSIQLVDETSDTLAEQDDAPAATQADNINKF